MRRHRPLLFFALTLIVIYGLAIAPWPGLHTAYLAAFQSAGRTMFSEFGSTGKVAFKPGSHSSGEWNSELILSNPQARVAMQRIYQTRQAYLATILTLTLVVATPIPWRRKWISLLIAMAIIHLFLAARLWLGLLDSFSEERMAVVQLSSFWKQAVRLAVTIFLVSPEATFFVPVFVWIIATFRREDLQRWGLIGSPGQEHVTPRRKGRKG